MSKLPKDERYKKLLAKIRIRLNLLNGGMGERLFTVEEVNEKWPTYGRALTRLSQLEPQDNGPFNEFSERYKVGRPSKVNRQGIKLYAAGGGWWLRKAKLSD